ncbi:MAG: hypothetical protein JSS27_21410 [Planctomycetes bacterium]|nr:hypothetical protein [Planctomycetota bacterium]
MNSVHRPTIRTLLLAIAYAIVLRPIYLYCVMLYGEVRDVWFASPFMLIPVLLPAFMRSRKRMFWGCFTSCLVYGTYIVVFEEPPLCDINLLMFYSTVTPDIDTNGLQNLTYYLFFLLFCSVFSVCYALTALLASHTYRQSRD